jgi:hypothetical protein
MPTDPADSASSSDARNRPGPYGTLLPPNASLAAASTAVLGPVADAATAILPPTPPASSAVAVFDAANALDIAMSAVPGSPLLSAAAKRKKGQSAIPPQTPAPTNDVDMVDLSTTTPPGGAQNVSPDFMATIKASIDQVSTDFTKICKDHAAETSKTFIDNIQLVVERQDRKNLRIATDISGNQKKISLLERDQAVNKADIAELRSVLHLLRVQPPHTDPAVTIATNGADTTGLWDRNIDETILKIESHNRAELARDTLKKNLDDLYVDANIGPDDFKLLDGPALANKFIVQFNGNAGLAMRNLTQATPMHKEKSGAYRNLTCKDSSGSEVRIYISPDENPHQIRTKYETKILGKLLRPDITPQLAANSKIHIQQRDGRIAINHSGLVKIHSKFQANPKLVWNRTLADEYKIDILELQDRFLKAIQNKGRDEGVEWSEV